MADGQVPETTASAGNETGAAPSGSSGSEKFDAEYVRQLREEAAKHRTEKAAAQAELKKLQDAQLSDAERQSKRLAELEAQSQRFDADKRDLQARLTVEREARKLGVIDEDAAYRLLDSSKLKFDDDGRPTNAGDLLKELVRERPYLSGQEPWRLSRYVFTLAAERYYVLQRESRGNPGCCARRTHNRLTG